MNIEPKLREHQIIDVWHQKQFRLNFAREIIRKLNASLTLDQIAQEALAELGKLT